MRLFFDLDRKRIVKEIDLFNAYCDWLSEQTVEDGYPFKEYLHKHLKEITSETLDALRARLLNA